MAALSTAVTSHASAHGDRLLSEVTQRTSLARIWMTYLRSTISRNIADSLLDSAQGAMIETAGCLSLGLVRAAIFSTRAQLELMLAWIYLNDHPVEWSYFQNTGRDYPSRANVLSYFRNNSERFQDRQKILSRKRRRKTEDPYGLLSIHVHTISPSVSPTIGPLSALVQPEPVCNEALELVSEVSEYITDIFIAWYADHWHDLPREATDDVSHRLTAPELAEFCR
jgi:hypothetical protein